MTAISKSNVRNCLSNNLPILKHPANFKIESLPDFTNMDFTLFGSSCGSSIQSSRKATWKWCEMAGSNKFHNRKVTGCQITLTCSGESSSGAQESPKLPFISRWIGAYETFTYGKLMVGSFPDDSPILPFRSFQGLSRTLLSPWNISSIVIVD